MGKKPDRLVHKREVLDRVPVSYPTIWSMMRAGTFPRSRRVGGKVCWLELELDAWISSRPVQPLKGDEAAA